MCWVTQGTPVEKVAEEDIPVFKYVFGDALESYYFSEHTYVIGRPLYTPLGYPSPVLGLRGGQSIGRGFHAYGVECTIKEFSRSLNVYPPRNNNYNIGSYNLYKLRRIECTIPKGSHYYVNNDMEYVSDTIIVNKITKKY